MKLNCGMARPEIARELAKSAYKFQAEMLHENTSSIVTEIESGIAEVNTDAIVNCSRDIRENVDNDGNSK